MSEDELTDAERNILLTPCTCGHTLNDHGSLGGCWVCNEEGPVECWVECEALMVERIGRIVAARVRALANGGAGDAQGGPGAPSRGSMSLRVTPTQKRAAEAVQRRREQQGRDIGASLRKIADARPFAGDDACD